MGAGAGIVGQDAAHRQYRGDGRGRVLGALAVGVFLAGAAVLVLPDLLFGIDRFTPFAQLVSLRPYLLAGVAVLVLGLLTLLVRSAQRRRRRAAVVALAAGLAVVGAVGAVLVVPRTLATPVPPAAPGDRVITVITFNTLEGGADLGAVAMLIRDEQPDLVSLVEAAESYRSRLAPLVEPLGYRLYTSDGEASGDLGGVTVAVADRLGDVSRSAQTNTPFPSVEMYGGNLGELRFVAFHSLAPREGYLRQWQSDLHRLARWCAGRGPTIIAGDFNATLDHSLFRSATAGCSDAAAQRGQGLVPTWPTWLPGWLGPQIDHVIATHPIIAEDFAVREIAGSDHRAVIARLRLPA